MRTTTRMALAVALPVALLTTGHSVSGAIPHSAAPRSSVPSSSTAQPADTPVGTAEGHSERFGDVPSDWTRLIDNTQTISIAVPSTWTAIDLRPTFGWTWADILATTDMDRFFPLGSEDTYRVPGVSYRAYLQQEVTPEWLVDSSTNPHGCTPGPVRTYDDGVFVGYIRSSDACGGTTSRIVEVVANPQSGSLTAYLLIKLTGAPDDAATLDGLLSSFTIASDSTELTTDVG